MRAPPSVIAAAPTGRRHYPDYTPDDFHYSPGDTSKNCGARSETPYHRQNNDGMPDVLRRELTRPLHYMIGGLERLIVHCFA